MRVKLKSRFPGNFETGRETHNPKSFTLTCNSTDGTDADAAAVEAVEPLSRGHGGLNADVCATH